MQNPIWILLVLMTMSAGCQRTELPIANGMVIASGTVTRNGQPLPHGRVSFLPQHDSSTQTSVASTENVPLASVSSGKFEVEIAPGTYRVEFHQFESPTNAEASGGLSVQVLPATFNKNSSLQATISADGPNQLTFQLDDTPRP